MNAKFTESDVEEAALTWLAATGYTILHGPEIEEMVGTKVYLELWVKVWERWRRRENMLRQLGYAVSKD